MADTKTPFSGQGQPAFKAVLGLALVVLIVVALILGLYLIGHEDSTTKPPAGTDDPPPVTDDFGKIVDQFRAGDSTPFEVLPEEETAVETYFSLYPVRTAYYQECTVARTGADGKHEQTKHILRDGNRYLIKTYEQENLTETLCCDGETVWVRDEVTGETATYAPEGDFTVYELASMPDHEEILRQAKSAQEEDSDVTKCTYLLNRARDLNMLVITLRYRDPAVTERYYYYLDYGMIYAADTMLGSQPTYTMTTTAFTTDITGRVGENTFTMAP